MKQVTYFVSLDGKRYDTVEACEAADKAYTEAHEKEIALKKERETRSNEVLDALKHALEVQKEAQKKVDEYVAKRQKEVDEANKAYVDLKNKFVKDYGSFYVNFRSEDDLNFNSWINFINSTFNNIFKF